MEEKLWNFPQNDNRSHTVYFKKVGKVKEILPQVKKDWLCNEQVSVQL